MIGAVVALAWLAVLPLIAVAAYRAVFCLAYLVSGRHATVDTRAATPLRRFAVVVPAHDEELLIGELIGSIRAVDYPEDRIAIHVIADNCSDGTAERARSLGAEVAERFDPDPAHRGKGQALSWMFEQLDLRGADAVVIFDADNLVDPGFFRAMNGAIEGGARCLQGYYDIANPGESTLTRMLAVTYVMKNLLYNGGKAALGLSVSLMGTGMVFVREVIEQGGWSSFTIGEDLEQSLALTERGERIRFVSEARIRAQESTSLRQGYVQRQRWATGRQTLGRRARALVVAGLRERSLHRIDAGIDILVPSYSKHLYLSLLAFAGSAVLFARAPALLWATGGVLLYQVGEVAIGLRLMRAGVHEVFSLALAPVFLVWKALIDALALVGFRRRVWARTDRQPHAQTLVSREKSLLEEPDPRRPS